MDFKLNIGCFNNPVDDWVNKVRPRFIELRKKRAYRQYLYLSRGVNG